MVTLLAAALIDDPALTDPFTAFLDAPYPVAAGFSSPLGSGWRSCGDTCWESERERPIVAMASGRVGVIDGSLLVEHAWYENHERREVAMVLSGVNFVVSDGSLVARGAAVATGRRVQLQLLGTEEPLAAFVHARKELPVPLAEESLALVSHDADELRLYRNGLEVARYQVGFGQQEGAKVRQGDNRTPKGVYYISQKSTGPFGGSLGYVFGGYWMRVTYPNAFDAARAVDQGWISVEQQASISRDWRARRETTKKTPLGGGIGVHAWPWEWSDTDPRGMSWGCVVMHPSDAAAIYAEMRVGTMVVLF